MMLKRIYCFLFGHDIIPMLTEDDNYIYTRGCRICGRTTVPAVWKDIPPPPNSTDKQKQIFEKFKLLHHQEVRDSIK